MLCQLNCNHKELTYYIGEENFDIIVDIVNKVDNLVYKGIVYELNKRSSDSKLVDEYKIQLKRLETVYHNIEIFYTQKSDSNSLQISL